MARGALLALWMEERGHKLRNAGSFQNLEKVRKEGFPQSLQKNAALLIL